MLAQASVSGSGSATPVVGLSIKALKLSGALTIRLPATLIAESSPAHFGSLFQVNQQPEYATMQGIG